MFEVIDGPGVQMLTGESLRAGGVVKDLLRAAPAGARGRASVDPTVLQAPVSRQAEVLEWGRGWHPERPPCVRHGMSQMSHLSRSQSIRLNPEPFTGDARGRLWFAFLLQS